MRNGPPRGRGAPFDRAIGPPGWNLLALLVVLTLPIAALAPVSSAQTLENSATGSSGSSALDPSGASVTLTRISQVATSVVAEISPNEVLTGSTGNTFAYDLLPEVNPGDAGVEQVEITVPDGYTGISVQGVVVGGVTLQREPALPGPNEYNVNVIGQTITITLGSKVSTTENIRVVLRADAPPAPGSSDFTSLVADGGMTLDALPGDADGDSEDANSISVEVLFSQGLVLDLVKEANKGEVFVGEVVTYLVAMRNANPDSSVVDVKVEDDLPPNFKYLAGSARLDGVVVADPTGNRTLTFDVGTVPRFVDDNGNGEVDPGEPGYRVLTYQTIVGAGATPGTYDNLVVAKDYCDVCNISNRSRAEVDVVPDPVFELSTIIGKVFNDADEDGWQDPDEPGVPGAMVALDDGTYAITDEYGRFHFPAVEPGQRMVKLNLGSLPGLAQATVDESHILWVSPGLLAKANFGVLLDQEAHEIGEPGQRGLAISGEERKPPIEVVGNAETMSVLVNGTLVPLPSSSVRMSVNDLDEAVHIAGGRLAEPVRFETEIKGQAAIESWTLSVLDSRGNAVRAFRGTDEPKHYIPWDGRDENGRLVDVGEVYQYQMEVVSADGGVSTSPRRLFGVNRTSVISLNLTGEAFEFDSDRLSPKAKDILRTAADILREYPDEKVLIEGHTDSKGSEAYNLELSRKRAQAAAGFLTGDMQLAGDRFMLAWYGESRPVASNDLEEGRELNRRVEVKGQRTETEKTAILDQVHVQPEVRLNGTSVTVGSQGRFAARLDSDATRVDIDIANSQGRSARATVPIPLVEILEPADRMLLPFGESTGGWSVTGPLYRGRTEKAEMMVKGRIRGRTDPTNAVEIDGAPVELGSDGSFSADIELGPGVNGAGILVRNPQGYARIVNLEVTVTDRGEDGAELFVTDAIPNLTINLPPRDAVLRSTRLTLSGRTDPGNQVSVNGQALAVEPDGRLFGAVQLPRGRSDLLVEVSDPEGNSGTVTHAVEVTETDLFLLAFAEGEYGRLEADGYIEGSGQDEQVDYYTKGRIAYYLKGVIAGKYLITSAFDSGREDLDELFTDLDGEETDQLLTNLDPDRFYPVYGDESTIVYDAESQGKFYLAVDSDAIHALVGNFALSLEDNELANYQRTLYGGRFIYESVSTTQYGDPDTRVVLFGSEVRNLHVRDELRATGGSLYYLSQRDVVDGSEQVTLVVRDENTGLILERRPQRQNVDYTIKYPEGRLMFRRPISSVVQGASVVNPEILSGNPVFVHVDYETLADSFEETSGGARVRRQIGDHVAIGGTYIDDNPSSGPYELKAGDAELRVGKNSRLVGEYAESQGTDAFIFHSEDGGLTYQSIPVSDLQDGKAWKAAAELDLGELAKRKPGDYWVKAYFKKLESGFFSAGNFLEQGTEKYGLAASARIDRHNMVSARQDRENRTDPGPPGAVDRSTITSAQWNHDRDRWRAALEYYETDSEDANGKQLNLNRFGAARLWVKLSERISSRVEHQQTIDGRENDQTTLGFELQVLPSLALDVEGVEGSLGRSAQAGAVWTLGDSRVYLTERISDGLAGEQLSTVMGAESQIGRSSKVYSEYQWVKSENSERTISLVGLQRQWEVATGLRFLASAEASKTDGGGADASRTSLAGSVTYGRPGIKALTRHEVRFEDGARDRTQYYTLNELDLKLVPDVTLLGRYRYSRTRDDVVDANEARLDERSLGVAYRPIHHDRVNALARYTRLSDQRPISLIGAEDSERVMDVVSVEGAISLNRYLEWWTKGAARVLDERIGDDPFVKTHTYLGIQRVNVNPWRRLDVGVEYRLLYQDEADDQLTGWLTEFAWRLTRYFRVGTGYNFTNFSDNEFKMNDYSVRGWFIRAQGRY